MLEVIRPKQQKGADRGEPSGSCNMAFKKPAEKRSVLKKNNVRVKNSYYTFSKDYPVGNIEKNRKYARRRHGKRSAFATAAFVIGVAAVVAVAYFVTSFCLKISYKPIEPSAPQEKRDGQYLLDEGMKAFYLPSDKLGDEKYISRLIRTIIFHDCNSVIIDFKTADGKIVFPCQNKTAIASRSAMYDNETVRKAVSMFKNRSINVIAGIYCFEDDLAARTQSECAVKYLNSDVVWLDSETEKLGKAWLNPYSAVAKEYLTDVIGQVCEFSVDAVVLKSVSFPRSGATDSAGYPGEKSKKKRNETLLSFVDDVKMLMPEGCLLYVSQSAQDVLSGNENAYFGSINSCSADGIIAELSQRPSGYEIDKSTKFSSVLTLSGMLKNAVGGKDLVLCVDSQEYSSKLLKAFKKGGYQGYAVYSEKGEY